MDSQWEFAVWLRELKLNPGLCNDFEGWDREGGSKRRGYRYTYGWIHFDMAETNKNTIEQLFFN